MVMLKIDGKNVGLMVGIPCGILVGIGLYTFHYAKGTSYMTDNPAACANCHIMQAHFDGWSKSSHHHVAACNDCHTPDHLISKVITKARNGLHHSIAFTSGRFHEPIQITEINREITEAACRRCHGDVVAMMEGRAQALGNNISCLHCHADVGHSNL